MSRRAWVLAALGAVLIAPPGTAVADELRLFGYDSAAAIAEEQDGEPYALVLWATDCAPCRRELGLLEELSRDHPELRLVLVATDPPGDVAAVREVLAQYALERADSWQFAEANVERLRYTIDPGWYGELPRAYLVDADGHHAAISGPLPEQRVRDWLASQH